MSSVYSDQHSEGGTLIRDSSRSTDGWEKRADGKWYKIDYYKVQEEKKDTGMEILERFFVGSFSVTKNDEWLRAKNITRVLVLGANSGVISAGNGAILRVLEVNDDNLADWLDEAVTLIKEAIAEGEASGASILMVCKDMITYCPIIVVAYLMAVMGWTLQTAKERVQGIFKITIAGFAMFTLSKWEEILQSRKTVSVKREVISKKDEQASPVSVSLPETVTVAPTIMPMTVTNPITVAAPVTYANPVFYNAPQFYQSYAAPSILPPIIQEPIIQEPLILPQPIAPTFTAPAYTAPIQQPMNWSWGNQFQSQYQMPQYSSFGSSFYSAPTTSYVQPSFNYIQQPQYQSFQTYQAPQVQSYTAPAQAASAAQNHQQQVIQTTTTTSGNVVRGSSSWHSGGVKVNTAHPTGHHGRF